MAIDPEILAIARNAISGGSPGDSPRAGSATADAARRALEDEEVGLKKLRDKLVPGLIDPFASTRMAAQKRALRIVKTPRERKKILEYVATYGAALEAMDREERSKAGYAKRFTGGLKKALNISGGSLTKTGDAFVGLAKNLTGNEKSTEDIAFERALEAARYGKNPEASFIDTPGVAGKVLRGAESAQEGAAMMAPDLIMGTAALGAGRGLALARGLAGRGVATAGKVAGAAFWSARQYNDSYGDLKEMGASDAKAKLTAAAIAIGTGTLEQFAPDPIGAFKGKGLIGPLTRKLSKKARQVVGKKIAGPTARTVAGKVVETGGRIASEIAEEGGQAAWDEAIKYNVAARDPNIEQRDVGDIGRNAWEAMLEAGPGIAALGGGGGVAGVGADLSRLRGKAAGYKQSKMETEVMRFAKTGGTPSRKQWSKWGGAAEDGKTKEDRRIGVKIIAKKLQNIARVRTIMDNRTPTREQWLEWGFDPKKGETPESRKFLLFEQTRKEYKADKVKQSELAAEQSLQAKDAEAADTVARAREERRDFEDFQESQPARPEGNLQPGEKQGRLPQALVDAQNRVAELDSQVAQAVEHAKRVEQDFAEFQETQPSVPEGAILSDDAQRKEDIKSELTLDAVFEAWKATTQPSNVPAASEGQIIPTEAVQAATGQPGVSQGASVALETVRGGAKGKALATETAQTPRTSTIEISVAGKRQTADQVEAIIQGHTLTEQQRKDLGSESAEEKARREADEADIAARPVIEASGFGPGGGKHLGKRKRSDYIGGEMPKMRDEVEADFTGSDTSLNVGEKIKEIARDALSETAKAMVRSQMHLAPNAENAAFNELFRIQKEVAGRAKESAVQTVGAIVSDLGPKQYDLFSRVTILRNLEASVKAKQPLRFKFKSLSEVQGELAKLEALVKKTPAVKKALAARKKIVAELVGQLIKAELLPKEALKSADTYYHQQVMLYAKVGRLSGFGSNTFSGAGKKKGFQKKRIEVKKGKSPLLGSEFNYNTNYLEADIAWISNAKEKLETKKILNKMMALSDIRSDLEKKAESIFKKEVESIKNETAKNKAIKNKAIKGKGWRDLAAEKDGYVTFRLPPGTAFSDAVTVQDQITDQIVREALEQGGVATDKNYSVMIDGTKGREVVIPANLARQLSERQRPKSKGIRRAIELAQQGWKLNILFRPNNVLAYLARNVTGDLDVSLAVDPGMRKFAKQAWKELRQHHGKSLSSTKLLDAARTYAAIGSGRTSQEYESIDSIDLFRRLNRKGLGAKTITAPVMAYYEFIRKHNAFREDVLRYAAFLSTREQLAAGRVKHYGGSKKEVVDVIHRDLGVDAAAAHMSRNLLGDYGNLTVAGEWTRRMMIPFWAFQEINLKRMPRIFINAIKAGQQIDSKSPVIKAAASTLLATRMAWMQGAVWVWNNLIMADDEEEFGTGLSEYDQANLAVRMGKNDDGSERIFRNVGALGDFLEWFGINEALISLPGVINKQISASDLIWQMGLSAPEKVIGSLRPEFTSGYSILTEQSLFPDVFNPRAIRRGEAVAQLFGATDEWKFTRGMTLGKGERARPHYFQRFMFGVSDPRQVALSSMYTLRNRFLKKRGEVDKTIYPVSKYKEARDAAKSGNHEAFSEWRQSFIETSKPGKAEDNFEGFLNRMDPISRLSKADRRGFEFEFLTDEQRGQLEVSRVYSGELRDLLWTWWVADRNKNSKKGSQ